MHPIKSLKKLISSVDNPKLLKFVVNNPILDQNKPASNIYKYPIFLSLHLKLDSLFLTPTFIIANIMPKFIDFILYFNNCEIIEI